MSTTGYAYATFTAAVFIFYKQKEYTNNPSSASLLNSIIGSLVAVAAVHGIPIDAAIATIVMLYILEIGINVFCKSTEPDSQEEQGKNNNSKLLYRRD